MKKTAAYEKHVALGAKMVPFAGYDMPVQYTGVNSEHAAVREAVGIFDVSHMGEFFVSGAAALDFLQQVTSNDVSKLTPGKVQYSCMPNGKGGIVDDLLIYCLAENSFMLVVNASNIDKDWDWLQGQMIADVKMENRSDGYSLFAVQGPKAAAAIQGLTAIELGSMAYYTFEQGTFAGVEDVIVSATGYTGSGGYEIYLPNKEAARVWDEILAIGESEGIQPIGLAARDTLRLEMGFCLYGNDLDDTTSPIEAGLGWITKFGKEFTDKPLLEKQKAEGTQRRLSGFLMVDRGIPRKGYRILSGDGEVIGLVTSGTQSPTLGKAIGLGYLKPAYKAPDTEIYIEIRDKPVLARVTAIPFYKK